MKAIGVDGCKKGWVYVSISKEKCNYGVCKDISELVSKVDSDAQILIDMPIGLPDKSFRQCDIQARETIGIRGSSVFNVPTRTAIYTKDEVEAKAINKSLTGKMFSIQLWCIVPKIIQLDTYLTENPNQVQRIKESHPEVAFWSLNNKIPLQFKKKDKNKTIYTGVEERLNILMKYDKRARDIYNCILSKTKRKNVQRDDIVDALCLAITQLLISKNNIKSIPNEIIKDEKGLNMNIYYFENKE